MDNTVGFLQSFLSPVDGIRSNIQHPSLSVNYAGYWGQSTHAQLQPQICSTFSTYYPKLLSCVLCLRRIFPHRSLCSSQACTNFQVSPQCKEQSKMTVLHHVLLLALNPPAQVFMAPPSP